MKSRKQTKDATVNQKHSTTGLSLERFSNLLLEHKDSDEMAKNDPIAK